MRVRFGDCVLDSGTRELFRGDERVHLPPTGFRLLELLLENRPRVVAKAEIHEKIWPGTFVSEATLASAISDIRAAIGDIGAKPRFVRTVHGFGYAFSGDAREASPRTPALTQPFQWRIILDDRQVELTEGENLIGREPDASVWIDASSISRRHARIVISGSRATLEDLGSKNGTFLSRARLTDPSPLEDGSEIQLGDVSMTIRRITPSSSTETI